MNSVIVTHLTLLAQHAQQKILQQSVICFTDNTFMFPLLHVQMNELLKQLTRYRVWS